MSEMRYGENGNSKASDLEGDGKVERKLIETQGLKWKQNIQFIENKRKLKM